MSSSMGNVVCKNDPSSSSPRKPQSPRKTDGWSSPTKTTSTSFQEQRQQQRFEDIRTYLDYHGYRLGDVLGEGSYSKVKACTRYSSVDGKYMYKLACKIIDKCRASDDFVTKFLPRELKIVRELNHPNIVRVWDIVQLRDNVYIFMDFCHGGDLLDYIKTTGRILEARSRHYFGQIVGAVRYMHNLDIAHRDLKCENVLITGTDQIKISDFGFSRYCHNGDGKRILSNTYCGSAAYAAPEILQGTGYNPKLYDCWSLGCVLYIMATGHMPFDESDIPKMLKFQLDRKLTFPSNSDGILSPGLKHLIRRLLEPDVTRRANIEVAANHEWLNPPLPPSPTSYYEGDSGHISARLTLPPRPDKGRLTTSPFDTGVSSPSTTARHCNGKSTYFARRRYGFMGGTPRSVTAKADSSGMDSLGTGSGYRPSHSNRR